MPAAACQTAYLDELEIAAMCVQLPHAGHARGAPKEISREHHLRWLLWRLLWRRLWRLRLRRRPRRRDCPRLGICRNWPWRLQLWQCLALQLCLSWLCLGLRLGLLMVPRLGILLGFPGLRSWFHLRLSWESHPQGPEEPGLAQAHQSCPVGSPTPGRRHQSGHVGDALTVVWRRAIKRMALSDLTVHLANHHGAAPSRADFARWSRCSILCTHP